jgi:hypothetical protein
MKSMLTLRIIGCTLLTLLTPGILQAQSGDSATYSQPKYVPFIEWCRTKKSLPAATQHTIAVLLKEAGTTNCDVANSKLKNMIALDLHSKQISDVRPIASLYELRRLFLSNNQISDVTSLASLTKLVDLRLQNNKISDVTPLANLTKLYALELQNNKIGDKTCPVKPASICQF